MDDVIINNCFKTQYAGEIYKSTLLLGLTVFLTSGFNEKLKINKEVWTIYNVHETLVIEGQVWSKRGLQKEITEITLIPDLWVWGRIGWNTQNIPIHEIIQ